LTGQTSEYELSRQ